MADAPSQPEFLVFGHAAEGLFVKVLGTLLTARARGRLKTAGVKVAITERHGSASTYAIEVPDRRNPVT